MNDGGKIANVCGYEDSLEMEEAMGIPPGALARTTTMMHYVIEMCKEHDKNFLFLDMDEDGTPQLNVFMVKKSDQFLQHGPTPGFIQKFHWRAGKEKEVFREISMSLVSMSRDWDAITDLNLNTLQGGPFFSQEAKKTALEQELGHGTVWFGQYDEQTLAMMMAQMGGMLPSDLIPE